jgi:hypothetical protein
VLIIPTITQLVTDLKTALPQGWRRGFICSGQPVTNARSETAQEKRMFRDAWRGRHCVVPCDGFYEWKDTPDGKQPYRFVYSTRELYWFAGLWSDNRFTILTRPARGAVANMHDRMPAIRHARLHQALHRAAAGFELLISSGQRTRRDEAGYSQTSVLLNHSAMSWLRRCMIAPRRP